jgi:YihY family inner membrane protein
MATKTEEKHVVADVENAAKAGGKTLLGFFNKFNNDWVMTFASALAFNLITAILPILIAILGILGFTVGNLSPSTEAQLLAQLKKVFPSSGDFLSLAATSLSKSAGLLVIIAILVAIFGGSRLFVSIEGYFDIIYHTRPRNVIKQNIMSVIMLLIFIVLIVPMVLTASVPAALQSLVQNTAIGQIPGSAIFFAVLGILVSILVSWVLFEAIYIVVPNQHISFRNSWLGAIVAAVLLQIYLALFPFYVTHFLGSYTGNIALAVILLFFFYYFAVILLIGAEINSFFAENIKATPQSIPVIVHEYTSHLPTTEKAMQEQATPTHKGEEPKDIRPKNEAGAQAATTPGAPTSPSSSTGGQAQMKRIERGNLFTRNAHKPKKSTPKTAQGGTSGVLIVAETLTGTILAFFVQLYLMQRKK